MLIGVCRISGFGFDFKNAGFTFNKAIDTDFIAPCTHEEADTRMFLHAKHAAIGGSKSINIVSSDTDVVVISVAVFDDLMMTANSSSTPISLRVKLSHGELKQWNTSVAFSNTFQTCHAVFLPFPTNADTVSQPVNA
jgi:hypothetical protein